MMGIVLPETCCACNTICNKYHLLHLVGILFPHNRLVSCLLSPSVILKITIFWEERVQFHRYALMCKRNLLPPPSGYTCLKTKGAGSFETLIPFFQTTSSQVLCYLYHLYSCNQYINHQMHLIKYNSWQVSNSNIFRHWGEGGTLVPKCVEFWYLSWI